MLLFDAVNRHVGTDLVVALLRLSRVVVWALALVMRCRACLGKPLLPYDTVAFEVLTCLRLYRAAALVPIRCVGTSLGFSATTLVPVSLCYRTIPSDLR